ncbi:MAG: DUF1853 family protein [Gammaproteobacteria bacterium]|nr:DUF1853 family protein [Gammaproteobacteria bacterium]
MSLPALLANLRQPQVRDLAWLAYAPNLLAEPAAQVVAADWFVQRNPNLQQQLAQWDAQPQVLLQALAKDKSHFLGPYFEQLVLFLLQHTPGVEVLAWRLQVQADGRTLGEFDVLFFDQLTGEQVHWELALKYYLGLGERWFGPNSNDRLDIRYAKLFDQQLLLGQTQAAFLREHGLVPPQRCQALMKGWLFSSSEPAELPDYVDRNHLHGHWCYVADIEKILIEAQTWVWLDKPHWLAPLSSEAVDGVGQAGLAMRARLDAHFAGAGPAVMLAGFVQQQGQWCELRRVMVVANSWPTTKTMKKDKP